MRERGLRGPARQQLVRWLRDQQTPAEEMLWELIRDRRLAGQKFRRQHALGTFIADFYCAKLRLVIELDGSVHRELRDRDQQRDALLATYNIHTIRIENADLFANPDQTLERLEALMTERAAQLQIKATQTKRTPSNKHE